MATPRPRIKLPRKIAAGDPFTVKTRITHPMHTGLRHDGKGKIVPRRIVNRFSVRFDGEEAFSVDLHPAIIILLLVAAGAVFGFIGLLVIVPLTALLRELFWYADSRLRGLEPDEALAQSHAARHFHLERAEQPPDAEPAEGEGAASAASSDQGGAS